MANQYLTNKELKKALEEYKTGDSNALATAARVLGSNLCFYLEKKGLEHDPAEVPQEAVLAVLSAAKKANPDLNLFAYFTTCVLNHLRHLARERACYRRTLAGYRSEVLGIRGCPGQAFDPD